MRAINEKRAFKELKRANFFNVSHRRANVRFIFQCFKVKLVSPFLKKGNASSYQRQRWVKLFHYIKKICDKICYHQENAHILRYELLQLYYCDPFKLHNKKISKDLCKTGSELVAVFKVKPGQKLSTNVIKKAT